MKRIWIHVQTRTAIPTKGTAWLGNLEVVARGRVSWVEGGHKTTKRP